MASGTFIAMRRPAEFFESDSIANVTNFAIKNGLEVFFSLHDAEPPREPPGEAAEPTAVERKRSRKPKRRS